MLKRKRCSKCADTASSELRKQTIAGSLLLSGSRSISFCLAVIVMFIDMMNAVFEITYFLPLFPPLKGL